MTTTPRIGIIGGSGLGNALLASAGATPVVVDTPFGAPSAPLLLMDWASIPIVFLARHGPGHLLSPSMVPYQANIWALKSLGCRWILASGAVGSLRQEIAPRDLIVVDQLIDRTTRRPGTFFSHAAVHVEFAQPMCPQLRQIVLHAAAAHFSSPATAAPKVHPSATYICMEGPAFSTRAESLMHRQLGGDLIGMTACPEAKLAREAQMSYALIALATDYDCWKPHDPSSPGGANLLNEIIANLHAATANALALIQAAIPHVWAARDHEFSAHRALELAIWSDKSKIPADVKKKLELLWGRYV